MLSFKTIAFLGITYFVGTLLSLFFEGQYLGQDQVDIANQLLGFRIDQLAGSGILAVPRMGLAIFTSALPKIILWDYAYWGGSWEIFRWLLVFTISFPVVIVLGFAFLSVTSQVFSRFLSR
tara:strand:- start:275 stop:637 length:363 start_codon:yes stop_codon:yes gene_type:complete